MKSTVGWKDLSFTIKLPKEDFEFIQSSVAVLKCQYQVFCTLLL